MKTHYMALIATAVVIFGTSVLNAQESKPVTIDQSAALAEKAIAQLAEAFSLRDEKGPQTQKRVRLLIQQAKVTAQEALKQHKQLPEKEKQKGPGKAFCWLCWWMQPSGYCPKAHGCQQ